MARGFTAGVATGILIVGLAGVITAVAHAPISSAASPSRTTTGVHGRAAQGKTKAGSQSQGTAGVAGWSTGTINGAVGGGIVSISSDANGSVRMIRLANGLTVTAINGSTITATLNRGFGLAGGTVVVGGPGFDLSGGPLPLMPKPGLGGAAPLTQTLKSGAPVTVTITVNATTAYTRAEQAASLSDIQVGSVLSVQGTWTGDNAITASAIEIELPRVAGVVTAVNGDNLTVTGLDARVYTIAVGDSTIYRRAEHTAALSDVAVGSLISAEGTLSSDGSTLSALAVTIQLPRVAGQVTAVNGDSVTVQGPDGKTSTVQLTDATAYSAGPQATASKSGVTVGSFIMAEGTLGSDGTLTALSVDIASGFDAKGGPGIQFAIPAPPGAGNIALPGGDLSTSGGSDPSTSTGAVF